MSVILYFFLKEAFQGLEASGHKAWTCPAAMRGQLPPGAPGGPTELCLWIGAAAVAAGAGAGPTGGLPGAREAPLALALALAVAHLSAGLRWVPSAGDPCPVRTVKAIGVSHTGPHSQHAEVPRRQPQCFL